MVDLSEPVVPDDRPSEVPVVRGHVSFPKPQNEGALMLSAEPQLTGRFGPAEHGVDARLRSRGPGLAKIVKRLVPHFAAESMVGEAVDVLGQPVRVDSLDDADDPRVDGAPAVLK